MTKRAPDTEHPVHRLRRLVIPPWLDELCDRPIWPVDDDEVVNVERKSVAQQYKSPRYR